MDEELKKIIEESERINLGHEQKLKIRNRLIRHMRDRPYLPQKGILEKLSGVFGASEPVFKMAPVLIIVLIFTGGGLFQMAERSLPGDFLYPIKTGINEEVKGLLLSSEEAMAEYEIDLANKRLDELETIEGQEPATEDVVTKLNEEIDRHVMRAEEKIREVEMKSADKTRVERVKNKLEKVNERKSKRVIYSGERGETFMLSLPSGESLSKPAERGKQRQVIESNKKDDGAGQNTFDVEQKPEDSEEGGYCGEKVGLWKDAESRLAIARQRYSQDRKKYSRDEISEINKILTDLDAKTAQLKEVKDQEEAAEYQKSIMEIIGALECAVFQSQE